MALKLKRTLLGNLVLRPTHDFVPSPEVCRNAGTVIDYTLKPKT